MIVKESITTEEHDYKCFEEGEQKMQFRPLQWYIDTFINNGFEVLYYKTHDRLKD